MFSEMPVFSKLGRTNSEMFLGRKINDRGCVVIVGGERGGRGLLRERITEVLMECSINNSRGEILSFSHSIYSS